MATDPRTTLTDRDPEPADGAGHLVRPMLARVAGVYALSRLATYLCAYVVHFVVPPLKGWHAIGSWDATWYLDIVANGYARSVPPGEGPVAQVNIAFFPAYPVTVRAVAAATGLSPVMAGVLVSLVGGLLATWLVALLAARLTDAEVGERAATLFAFFPGAFVLSMAYSEGLFLAAASGALYALHQRRWLLAGLAGAVATGARPTGMVLAAAAGWAALVAIRQRREWRALLAPALTPLGLVAYFVYLEFHTGTYRSWSETEERGWFGQRFDFGITTAGRVWRLVQDPLGDPLTFYSITPIVLVAIGVYLLLRWRPPAPVTIYALGTLALVLGSAQLWSTWRYLLAAFPLLIAFARVLRGTWFAVAVAASGTLMAFLFFLSALSNAYIP